MAFTLATNAGATELRIEGTDSNITWPDIWDWDDGGGSSAGDGDVPKDGGGTVKLNTLMTQVPNTNESMFVIATGIDVIFGDGANSLTFDSKHEMVYFDDDASFAILDNCTLSLGDLSGDWGMNGAVWNFSPANDMDVIAAGQSSAVFKLYASMLINRAIKNIKWHDGTIDIRNSIFSGLGNLTSKGVYFDSGIDNLTVNRFYSCNNMGLTFLSTPDTGENIHTHHLQDSLAATAGLELTGVLITDSQSKDITVPPGQNVTLINPVEEPINILIIVSGWCLVQYTCDIHVVDKDGNNLSGVTVDCQDKNDDYVWTQGSVTTDANGDITQQVIDYKKWEGNDETLTTYSPHKFILSKSGYPTLTISNVTVSDKIDWSIDMGQSTSDLEAIVQDVLEDNSLDQAAKLLVNKAIQNKNTGAINYYDDDDVTIILTHTPTDGESTITRTPS